MRRALPAARAMRVLLAALAAGALVACAGPRFLGAPIRPPGTSYRACKAWASWQTDRLVPGYVDADPALHAYVASVLARLIRANHLEVTPRVEIVAGRGGSAEPSDVIYVGRSLLARLDSEAALAALLAHELAHVEAGTAHWFEHGPAPAIAAWSRAYESAADERAVQLVRRAGYDPRAMLDVLDAIADPSASPPPDPFHPAALRRRARVAAVIAGRAGGAWGRARYRRHLDGLLVGVDPRFATAIDQAAVSLAVGVAIGAPLASEAGTRESVRAQVIAAPVGDRIAARLAQPRVRRIAGHVVLTGVVPRRVERAEPGARTACDEALADVLSDRIGDVDGARIVLVRGPGVDLWLHLDGPEAIHRAAAMLARLRTPTAAERARIRPRRLRFHPAAASGTYAQVAARTCATPSDVALDDPQRLVRAGEPIKCADLDPAPGPTALR